MPDPGETLHLIDAWPVTTAAAAVLRSGSLVTDRGPTEHVFRLASLSKPIAAWAVLVAVEEGTVDLDEPIAGSSLRHLLAHAGGFGFDGAAPITRPGRRRIYSNTGIEKATEVVAERAGLPFADYLREAVFEPLGMRSTTLRGSPAHGVHANVADVCRFLAETSHPRLVAVETARAATSVQFPGLAGLVPGVGSFVDNAWGLGFEIRDGKSPHWTGTGNSPATYGHFGGSGTMMWVDPSVDLALVALTDRDFDEWSTDALRLWPELSDAVLGAFGRAPETGNPR